MEIELATKNDYQIIRITEDIRLDTNIVDVKTIVEEMVEEGIYNFAISLTPGSHLSSMSIGIVLQCFSLVKDKNGKFALVNPNEDDEELLEVLGLTSLIKICKSEDNL